MPHHVFNIKEVAGYLHLSVDDIERLVREREIPHERLRDRIQFHRPEIDAWASKRILLLSRKDLTQYHSTSSEKVKESSGTHAVMTDLITAERISPALPARTAASVVREMCALADLSGLVSDPADLFRSIKEREELCSTAMPGGLALLHPRQHEPYMFTESFIVLGRTVQGIHFGAPDGSTTQLFFMVCCQDDRLHLHTLTRLCLMCQQTTLINGLFEADSAKTMVAAILHSETEIISRL